MLIDKNLANKLFSVAIAMTCLQLSAMQQQEVKLKADQEMSNNLNCPLLSQLVPESHYNVYDWTHAITVLKTVDVNKPDGVTYATWKIKAIYLCCFPLGLMDTQYRVIWNDGRPVFASRKMPVYLYKLYEQGKIKLEGTFKGDPLFSGNGKHFVVAHEEAAKKELEEAHLNKNQIALLDDIEHQLLKIPQALIYKNKQNIFDSLPLHARKNLGRVCIFEKNMSCCGILGWLFCGSLQ
jgi:hypothetical protein